MGGPSQSTQQQQVSKVELPAWVDEAAQANYKQAVDVAGRPLQQYGGERVAGPSDMTTQGYGMLKSGAGATAPMYDDAAAMFKSSAGDLDIQKYLNPYTDEVVNRTTDNATTALQKQLGGIASSAQKASSFGGSRFGVQQGVAQAEGVRNIADVTAELRKAGFDTAAGIAQNQQAGQRAAATGLLSTAAGKGSQNIADASTLLSAGNQDTAARQKLIDADMSKFQEAWQYPVEQLNLKLAALGMTPYGKTQSTSGSTETSTSPDWATVGLGALKGLPGAVSGLTSLLALSDRNTKTDITKLTDGDIPMYSYRYKGDPKTYPKIVGPMAQDIEKKHPKAIKKVGKFKTIDINNLMEALA
jgi:hypothetical protein